MALSFRDMLKADESLIRDDVPLSYDYLPKVLPYREKEQRQFALAIKPLLNEQNGRNLFVYGAPGIGKTAACRHVIRELEDTTDDVIPLYINCWKHNSAFKILLEMCNQLGIRLIAQQKTSELFDKVKTLVNKKSVVFVFDEIDKLDDFDVVYMILEDIYRKSIFLITNYRNKVEELDERIMSRLNPEFVEFKPYGAAETRGILAERLKYAFVQGVWDDGAFALVVEKTGRVGDVRNGLFLMREAAHIAEEKAVRVITAEHVQAAIVKADQFRTDDELDEDLKGIFELVKAKNGLKMGDLFKKYSDGGGELSYRTFTRKIERLEGAKLVAMERISGADGNTTIVHVHKKLTDY
jgi:cell division control protein 6